MGLLGAKPAWRIAAHHRNFFGGCNLQGAIDFAELRKRSWRRVAKWSTFFGVAGFAPERFLNNFIILLFPLYCLVFHDVFSDVYFLDMLLHLFY